MKKLLILLTGLTWSVFVFARCSDRELLVFPTSHTIKQNSIIVLDGYGRSQSVITALNDKHATYLKSGNSVVKLVVKEICVGQFHLTQAVLIPEVRLEAGIEYEFCIDNLPEYERISQYNVKTQKYEPIKFAVVAGIDIENPILTGRPKEIDKSYYLMGCGPSASVNFNFPVKDDSELIIKTTVKNVKTEKEVTYYIQPRNEQIMVGYDMCYGAFTFDDGDNFEVKFSFMDASGNLTDWIGDGIKFTKPTD